MVPVPPFPHFSKAPMEDELNCLNLTIVLPPPTTTTPAAPLPVMLWIHGGSFLFGSSTHPCYDTVNLATFSASPAIATPIIAISINYRVGLFGFLASHAIAADLAADGFAGAGNFGLTDQQTALRWVQRYVGSMGGDPDNVTIFGESAGGMSVAQQVWAKDPAPFARAVSMSGTLNTIPAWPLEWHERRYRALLEHLNIIGEEADDDGGVAELERLRRVPQDAIAAATCVIEGGMGATANPCADGWYHAQVPSLGAGGIVSPPAWLRSYMVGDVRDEAMIFRGALDDQDYASILAHFSGFMDEEDAVDVLGRYGIAADISHEVLECRFEEMATDAIFWVQTYLHAHASRVERTYAYHVDQVSTLDNALKGLAYHAIELLYVFRNLEEEMTEGQRALSRKMAADFVRFAYGEDPWERFGEGKKWMVYGPNDKWAVKSESDDEDVRRYARMKKILDAGLFPKWAAAVDYVVNKRWILGAVVPSKDQ